MPDGHEASSVAGQFAGLYSTPPTDIVGPDHLVLAFCTDRDAAYLGHDPSGKGHDTEIGYVYQRGFCGYNGRRDTNDPLLTGFDDGYEFMGYLQDHGWSADHTMGDWPYVVFLHFKSNPLIMASYCEGDFTLLQFPDAAAKQAFKRADAKLRH
jgi:hypothetical protein